MNLILMAAITVDGKIARGKTELANWTSKEDKDLFRSETKKHGVVIMGRSTFDTIKKPLPDRLNIIMTRDVADKQNIPNLLEYSSKAPSEIIKDIEKRGYATAVLAGGASIYKQFLNEGLITEIMVTIEPKIFGKGVNLFSDEEAREKNLELIEHRLLNTHSMFLHYKVIN